MKICPKCKGELEFIAEHKGFYCFSCSQYFKLVGNGILMEARQLPPPPEYQEQGGEETLVEAVENITTTESPEVHRPTETVEDFTPEEGQEIEELEMPEELVKELAPTEDQEEQWPEETAEELASTENQEERWPEETAEELATTENQEEQWPEETTKKFVRGEGQGLKEPKKRRKRKYFNYRYRTRIFKGTILPILFGVMSVQMLNKYIYEFPGYFEYEIEMILAGFLLGFIALSGITLANLVRAKRNPTNGCKLRVAVGLFAYLPFIIILLILAFFEGISLAWQFSTGFFLAAIFPLIFVTLYETGSKGKFFVQEKASDPSKERKLIFMRQ